MYDRVSTVQLPDYFSNVYNLTDAPLGPLSANSVFLGKKGAGQFDSKKFSAFNVQVSYPKLDGWVEYDSFGRRVYPDYTFPITQKKLPEWVVAKNYYQSFVGSNQLRNAPRYIIGEDPLIGPFTFTEAVKIYSVVKKIKANRTLLSPVSVSGLGLNVSVSLNFEEWFHIQSNSHTYLDPRYLFSPEYKNYQYNSGLLPPPPDGNWHFATNDRGEDGSDSLYLRECRVYEGMDAITNFSLPSYSGGSLSMMPIVMDVDNYSDFYIDVNHFFQYYFYLDADLGHIFYPPDPDAPPDSDARVLDITRTSVYVHDYYHVGKLKYWMEEGTTSENSGANITKFSSVTRDAKLKIGSITKKFVLNGYRLELQSIQSSDFYTPPEIIIGGRELTPIEFEVDEFWPYKNANGQPVYNTKTGKIINPPTP